MVGLNGRIPGQIASGIRVGATEVGVVAAGYTIVARVLPAQIPTVNRRCAIIGDYYFGIKSVIPLVIDHILTGSVSCGGERKCSQR